MTPLIAITTPETLSYIEDVILLPLDHETDDYFQQHIGRTYEAIPSFPVHVLPPFPRKAPPRKGLHVSAIRGFKRIGMLEERVLTDTPDAIERLVQLKSFINDLQKKRSSYWKRQTAIIGTAAGLSVATSGISAVGGLLASAHQNGRLGKIKASIRHAIQQINEIRNVYGKDELWEEGEALEHIDSRVFSVAIERHELNGSL